MNPPAQVLTPQQGQALAAAQRQLAQGQLDAALHTARALAESAPGAPDAQQLLGMCLGEAGQFGAAEAAFLQALKHAPSHPLILTNLAALYRKGGALDAAIRVLRQATAAAPGFARAWQELGRCLLESGQAAAAVNALEQAVSVAPNAAIGWQLLGRAHRDSEQYQAAEQALQRATELTPGSGTAWMNLGAVRRLDGRAEEALSCYDQAARCGYQGPDLADARVGALLDLGQTRAALSEAQRLVERHPTFAGGHRTLAHLLWEHGPALAPMEDPLARFGEAVKRSGDRSLRLAYAQFLLEARQAEAALAQFAQLRAEADHSILKAMAGNAHEQLGQFEQSARLYADAYREQADNPPFLCAYSRHLLRAGDWARARDLSAHAVAIAPDDQEAWAYLGTAWRLLGDEREFWLCEYDTLVSLHEVPPAEGFDDLASFLVALRSTLEPMHQARREPVQQSLRGGSQTPGRLFGRPDPVLKGLQQSLTRTIEAWLAHLARQKPFSPAAEHPFYRRLAASIHYTGSWSVKLWSSGKHVDHIHPQGWISSAYYVALPPSVVAAQQAGDSSAGAIQFGQPPAELGLKLGPRRVIRPQLGHLALFPSYLWHGTVPFSDEEPRMTIAFDMRPEQAG